MGCCHEYFANTGAGDDAFTIDAAHMTFGAGCLNEAGDRPALPGHFGADSQVDEPGARGVVGRVRQDRLSHHDPQTVRHRPDGTPVSRGRDRSTTGVLPGADPA